MNTRGRNDRLDVTPEALRDLHTSQVTRSGRPRDWIAERVGGGSACQELAVGERDKSIPPARPARTSESLGLVRIWSSNRTSSLVDVAGCEGGAGSVDSAVEAEVGLDSSPSAWGLGDAGEPPKR